jgi:hypothetical protein
MKSLLIHLEDREWEKLVKVKQKTGKTWKQLLMTLCESDETEKPKVKRHEF